MSDIIPGVQVPMGSLSKVAFRSAESKTARRAGLSTITIYVAYIGQTGSPFGYGPYMPYPDRDTAMAKLKNAMAAVNLYNSVNPVPGMPTQTWLDVSDSVAATHPHWRVKFLEYVRNYNYDNGQIVGMWLGGTPIQGNWSDYVASWYSDGPPNQFDSRLTPLATTLNTTLGFWSGITDDQYGGAWIEGAKVRIDGPGALYNSRNHGGCIVSAPPYTVNRVLDSVSMVGETGYGQIVFPVADFNDFNPVSPGLMTPPMQLAWDAEYHWLSDTCLDV
jgi:hypothetical protein